MDIRWIPLVGKTGYILAAGALIPTYILNDREIVLVDSGLPGRSCSWTRDCIMIPAWSLSSGL